MDSDIPVVFRLSPRERTRRMEKEMEKNNRKKNQMRDELDPQNRRFVRRDSSPGWLRPWRARVSRASAGDTTCGMRGNGTCILLLPLKLIAVMRARVPPGITKTSFFLSNSLSFPLSCNCSAVNEFSYSLGTELPSPSNEIFPYSFLTEGALSR